MAGELGTDPESARVPAMFSAAVEAEREYRAARAATGPAETAETEARAAADLYDKARAKEARAKCRAAARAAGLEASPRDLARAEQEARSRDFEDDRRPEPWRVVWLATEATRAAWARARAAELVAVRTREAWARAAIGAALAAPVRVQCPECIGVAAGECSDHGVTWKLCPDCAAGVDYPSDEPAAGGCSVTARRNVAEQAAPMIPPAPAGHVGSWPCNPVEVWPEHMGMTATGRYVAITCTACGLQSVWDDSGPHPEWCGCDDGDELTDEAEAAFQAVRRAAMTAAGVTV